MKKLFINNENNKLNCTAFLHVCMHTGVDPWPIDQGYEIYTGQKWRGTYMGEAKIVTKKLSTVGNLNASVAAITTGFSIQTLKESISDFPLLNSQQIFLITFRYLTYSQDHALGEKEPIRKKFIQNKLEI